MTKYPSVLRQLVHWGVFIFLGLCAYTTHAAGKTEECVDHLKIPEHDALKLASLISIEKMKEPVVIQREGKTGLPRGEVAIYKRVNNPEVQAQINEISAAGGQVRLLKAGRIVGERFKPTGWNPPHFRVDLNPQSKTYLMPIIGIDLMGDRALAALTHEMEHFRFWKRFYDQLRAQGLDHEAASKEAIAMSYSGDNFVEGERNAVMAEIENERRYPSHPFNLNKTMNRPFHFFEYGYVNRVVYPEFEGIRMALLREKSGEALDMQLIEKWFREMIRITEDTRAHAVSHLAAHAPENPDLMAWRVESTFNLIVTPYGIERLLQDKTEARFQELLNQFLHN